MAPADPDGSPASRGPAVTPGDGRVVRDSAELQRRLERPESLAADLARKNHLAAKHVATFGNCTHADCRQFYGSGVAFRGNH